MTSNASILLISLVTGKEVIQFPSGSFRVGFHNRIPDHQLDLLDQKGVRLVEEEDDKDGGSYRFTRFAYRLAEPAN